MGLVAALARRTRTMKRWNGTRADSLLPERARSEWARSTAAVGPAGVPFHERAARELGGIRSSLLLRRWRGSGWQFVLITMGLLLAPMVARAESPSVIEVGKFSGGTVGQVPEGWNPLAFKKISKQTSYELAKDGERVVVKAISDASASGLTKAVRIDPREYPILRWRWRVENILTRSDVRRKEGDDYPARLYVTFAYDPEKTSFAKKLQYKAGRVIFGDIPIGAINYIWDRDTPIGRIVENAYTSFARMIVVESGPQKVGAWVDEERNLYEDYKAAFGEEPPMVNGVAIMTDTDNTKERATAYYGDIIFLQSAGAIPR